MTEITVRNMIRNLMEYNLDAEFVIMDNEGYPINITEFNVGWQMGNGEEMTEERDIDLERKTCTKLVLFPNNTGCER